MQAYMFRQLSAGRRVLMRAYRREHLNTADRQLDTMLTHDRRKFGDPLVLAGRAIERGPAVMFVLRWLCLNDVGSLVADANDTATHSKAA